MNQHFKILTYNQPVSTIHPKHSMTSELTEWTGSYLHRGQEMLPQSQSSPKLKLLTQQWQHVVDATSMSLKKQI